MKNFLSHAFFGLFSVFLISSSSACSVGFKDKLEGGRCVDVGQYQVYAKIFGKSAPVVILDAGSGDDLSVWNAVAPSVAKFAKVVVYDRPGLGKSDAMPGDGAISSKDIVEMLQTLLKKENIKPPYILVGHSRGGLNMQYFAAKYPREVAGVVLIDSVSRNQAFHDPAPAKTSNCYREAISFDESRLQVKKAGAFPSVPLIVLTATNHHEAKARELLWRQWQQEMAQLSPQGVHIFAWKSGHYIQKQQPELVIDAIYTAIQLAKM